MTKRRARTPISLAVLFVVAATTAPLAAKQVDVTLRVDPDRHAGADPRGRVLLYAPDPVEAGSSISHWDLSAMPDLLMEPNASPRLPFGQVDLTLPLFEDLGWQPGTAQITLSFNDDAGKGFNDPTLGAQRKAAIRKAVDIWAKLLDSSVELNLGLDFQSLDCSNGSGVLAQAGPQFVFESFPHAPLAHTWYPGPLAEALSGQNLSLQDVANPNAADISASFNSDIDTGCLGAGTRFYYGLDGNIPAGQVSFIEVALHELGHGLGFLSLVNLDTGGFFQSLPDVYSRQIFDGDFGRTWVQLNANQRRQSAVHSGRVAWNGQRVTAAARTFLDPAPVLSVDAPAAIAGTYPVAVAAFGPLLTLGGISGSLAVVDDGSAAPTLGCGALVNGAEIQGKVALVDRGTCNFTVKAKNAQNAGAVGVVIVYDQPGLPFSPGGNDPSIVIPVVQIGQQDGELLKTAVLVGLPPQAPTGLNAQPQGGGVHLSWTDNADDELGFRLERRLGGGSFQEIAQPPADATSYQDDGVEPGMTYSYRLRAENAAGFSPFTAPVTVTVEELLPPAAPDQLEATALSETDVSLTWRDRSNSETAFVLEQRAVARRESGGGITFLGEPFTDVAQIPGDTTSFTVSGLAPETTYNFRLRARGAGGDSEVSNEAAATTYTTGGAAPCVAGPETLCLSGQRFSVRVFFANQHDSGAPGVGKAIPYSPETGFFWFFSDTNIELVTKVLDATSFADAYWFFYGGLSDVEYWIVVTDTENGRVNTYYNEPGNICGDADTMAFPLEPTPSSEAGSAAGRIGALSLPGSGVLRAPAVETVAPACQGDDETLCLLGHRFRVTVHWSDPRSATSGPGHAIIDSRGDSTGYFWFFGPDNIELVLKMLDGRALTGKFWVFYGALSDVEYDIEVEDTMTGDHVEYHNPAGNICGLGDTQALD